MKLPYPEMSPVPRQADYTAAYERHDEELKSQGGAWVAVMRRAEVIRRSESIYATYRGINVVGVLLEKYNAEDFKALDPTFSVGHAFTRGFMHQEVPLRGMYSINVNTEKLKEELHTSFLAQKFDRIISKEDQADAARDYIIATGMYGLSMVGEGAEEYLDKWSADVYPASVDKQRIFKLGHGAAVACAVKWQESVNNRIVARVTDDLHIAAELEELFSPDTGS